MNDPDRKEYEQGGRGGGGDSGGGAYPNPHSGKTPAKDGFLGSGGQSGKAYHGGDNPNAPDRRQSAEESGDEER